MTDAWRVELTPAARRDLRRLDPPVRQRIIAALDALVSESLMGDVKRLTGQPPEWRLRVGDWRVRFTRDASARAVIVLRVLPRGRAYRD